jgi:hypothetical protein
MIKMTKGKRVATSKQAEYKQRQDWSNWLVYGLQQESKAEKI